VKLNFRKITSHQSPTYDLKCFCDINGLNIWFDCITILGTHEIPTVILERLPDHAKVFGALRIIVHSNFRFDTLDYDIALVR